MPTVAVTGMGAVSAAGLDEDALMRSVWAGISGIQAVQRFDVSAFAGPWAGEVDLEALRARAPDTTKNADPCTLMALDAAQQAWNQAAPGCAPDRVALVLGTSAGNHNTEDLSEAQELTDPAGAFRAKEASRHWTTAHLIAEHLGIAGPRMTVSSACASGSLAFALARQLIEEGLADVVLAGGADAISIRRFAGFDALGVVSPQPGAPFSHPTGMNVGEGAAFLVLEKEPTKPPRAWLIGSGGSCDAHHATAPEPTGAGITRSMEEALRDGGVLADDVNVVCTHATGTEANDAAEWRAVDAVFGARSSELPWVAAKGYFGHSFGAAGALESVLLVRCLEEQRVPAPAAWTGPRGLGPQSPGGPRSGNLAIALGTNAAFGGANASLVWSRQPAGRGQSPPRRVWLRGLGRFLGPPDAEPTAAETRQAMRRAVRGLDPRSLDAPASWLCLAVAAALTDAELRVSGATRDRVGIVGASSRRSVRTSDAIRSSVDQRGIGGLSALAFSRTVLNAPQGAAARAFSLRGPSTTFAPGPGAGVFAAVLACSALRMREDADHLVVAGVDELDPAAASLDPGESSRVRTGGSWPALGGAAAAVFSTDGGSREVLGIGLTGPGALSEAVTQALSSWGASVRPAVVVGVPRTTEEAQQWRGVLASILPAATWHLGPGPTLGVGDSSGGLLALAEALDQPEPVLVVVEHEGTGCAALFLSGRPAPFES